MIGMWNARAQELSDRGAPLKIVWDGRELRRYWYARKERREPNLAFRSSTSFTPQAQADSSTLPYGRRIRRAFRVPSRRRRAK